MITNFFLQKWTKLKLNQWRHKKWNEATILETFMYSSLIEYETIFK